ncbi:hypothetical protein EPO66_02315, partial [bacterium]
FLFLGPLPAETNGWKEFKSTHFIVYYKNAPEDFISKTSDKAEGYYNKIADDLGFRRYNFWLWDNRAKIYIYDDAKAFQLATGQPSWSAGCANVNDKIINSYPYAETFFQTILPHEIGHIIFREFVGFDNPSIPLWLDEGVASYQENLRSAMARDMLRSVLREKKLLSLSQLSQFNPHFSRDSYTVGLFYAESVNLVDFLIREYGTDNFVSFCQGLRDKKNFERALSSVYPFDNFNEFDEAWQKNIAE